MISLDILIKTAPFDPQTQAILLKRIEEGNLDDNQKLALTNLSWEMIIKLYQSKLEARTLEMMMEQAEGKAVYSQNDFSEERTRLVNEFAQSLDLALSKDEIDKIKKKIDPQT